MKDKPANQLPYIPEKVSMDVSASDINDQLDITYQRPVANRLDYPTFDGGSAVTAYRIEWDTQATFNSGVGGAVLGSYDAPALSMTGTAVSCANSAPCTHAIGSEVQMVTVYADNMVTIAQGGFKLKYTGLVPQRAGGDATVAVPAGAVATAQTTNTIAGARSSPTGCLKYDATATEFRNELMTLGLVDGVTVSKAAYTDANGAGFQYRITFSGKAVSGNVEQVTADATGCTAFLANTGVKSETVSQGGQLTAGTEYYVRVRAVNAVGAGAPMRAYSTELNTVAESGAPFQNSVSVATPTQLWHTAGPAFVWTGVFGEIPRSPPGPPTTVQVEAVRDESTSLLVRWSRPTTENGDAILSYIIEWTEAADWNGALATVCPHRYGTIKIDVDALIGSAATNAGADLVETITAGTDVAVAAAQITTNSVAGSGLTLKYTTTSTTSISSVTVTNPGTLFNSSPMRSI